MNTFFKTLNPNSKANKLNKRLLTLESLENRELLSVNPLGIDNQVDYVQTAQIQQNVSTEAQDVTTEAVAFEAAGTTVAGTTVNYSLSGLTDGTEYKVTLEDSSTGNAISGKEETFTADSTGAKTGSFTSVATGKYKLNLVATSDSGTSLGKSAELTVAAATPGAKTPIVAVPGAVTVTNPTSDYKVKFSTAVSETDPAATEYNFRYKVAGSADDWTECTAGTATNGKFEFTLTTALTVGKVYEVQAFAVDKAAVTTGTVAAEIVGGCSETVFYDTGTAAPAAPTAGSLALGTGAQTDVVIVKWTASTTKDVVYKVVLNDGTTDIATLYTTGAEISYKTGFDTTGKTVTAKIYAVLGSSTSAELDAGTGVTAKAPTAVATSPKAAAAVTNVAAKLSTDGKIATVTWKVPATPAADAATSAPAGYIVEYQAGTGSWAAVSVTGATTATATISGLQSGTTYKFRVISVGAEVSSEFQPNSAVVDAAATVTTKAAALGAAKVAVEGTSTSSQIAFKITDPTTGTAPYGYAVVITDVTNTKAKAIISEFKAGAGEYTMTGLNAKSKYEIVVTTLDATGAVPSVTPKTGKATLATADLAAPTAKVVTTIVGGDITVTDKETKSGYKADTEKRMYVEVVATPPRGTPIDWSSPAASFELTAGATDSKKGTPFTASMTGLTAGLSYSYRVIEIADHKSATDAEATVQQVVTKTGTFKTPAFPLPTIAKGGFGMIYDTANSKASLGVQLQVKDPAPKTMPGYVKGAGAVTGKDTSMKVSYQLFASAKADVGKVKTDTANFGRLLEGIEITLDAADSGQKTPTDATNKTAKDFKVIDLNTILTALAADTENKAVMDDLAKGFKSLNFQLVTTYHDPGSASNVQTSYSKVFKLTMPKFLAPQTPPTP